MDKINKDPELTLEAYQTWPPLLTIEQVSNILNISKWTLRKWDNEGKLKAIRIGSRKDRRYSKEQVLKILKEGIK